VPGILVRCKYEHIDIPVGFTPVSAEAQDYSSTRVTTPWILSDGSW
jgi:hypothetical protein